MISNQFLVIIRGAPASGKTTIAKKFRSFNEKIVWLKVDNFKDFFSGEASLDEQKYVDECALATLEYFVGQWFFRRDGKDFFDPSIIPLAVDVANEKAVKVKVFQIKCSLATLLERDRSRPGIKEGCHKPMGDEAIGRIYKQLEKTFLPNAKVLDTEKFSVEECVAKIKKSL